MNVPYPAGKSLSLLCGLVSATVATVAFGATPVLKDRTIGYVMTHKVLSVYQTPGGKDECPQGFNDGPREQFTKLYPNGGKLAETQLEREREVWHPDAAPEALPYYDVAGHIAIGLNLDGKVGPNDFTSPTGETGIDNQLYRVIGCVGTHRGPTGVNYFATQRYMQRYRYDRVVIELTDVDSLENDGDVTVSISRGLDHLTSGVLDTPNEFLPGGTQRPDTRWGKRFMKTVHGKIENGVLTTDPVDVYLPESIDAYIMHFVHDWRLRLKVSPERAEGLMGGYLDVERFYVGLARNMSTHYRSYDRESLPSEYRSLRRNADAYPDPKTGVNTAISAAWNVKFVQVFIEHPPAPVALNDGDSAKAARSEAGR